MRAFQLLSLIGLLLAPACGAPPKDGGGPAKDPGEAGAFLDSLSPAPLRRDDGAFWAGTSAPNAFFTGYFPLATVEGTTEDGEERSCPEVIESDQATTYEGGCTDADGVRWEGRATVDAQGARYQGFSLTQPSESCPGEEDLLIFDGTMDVQGLDDLHFSLDLLLTVDAWDEGCDRKPNRVGWDYQGNLVETEDGAQTWNGSGQMGNELLGLVRVETRDEHLDGQLCPSEPLSGETRVRSGGDEIVYIYDGATDCDQAGTVTWTYNGEAMGEVEGVACASTRPMRGWGWLGAIVAIASLLCRRRPLAGVRGP